MTTAFTQTPWLLDAQRHASPSWKRALYRVALPAISSRGRRHLSPETLEGFRPELVLFSRGMPLEDRRRWATGGRSLKGGTVLVQGTGTGWDVLTWAAMQPERIIATDLFPFAESWAEIAEFCAARHGVRVEFRQADLARHEFLPDASIDLCASDAVYEHCTNLDAVMRETFRLLKPGGTVYATYGPMWFCAGGDHFARGGLRNVFNHLLLDPEDYRRYFETHLRETEDFQAGGRYVRLGLFSHLTTRDYLDIYRRSGFAVDSLILELSDDAVAFARRFPGPFAELIEEHRGRCTRDDFLIKANFIRLKKPQPRG